MLGQMTTPVAPLCRWVSQICLAAKSPAECSHTPIHRCTLASVPMTAAWACLAGPSQVGVCTVWGEHDSHNSATRTCCRTDGLPSRSDRCRRSPRNVIVNGKHALREGCWHSASSVETAALVLYGHFKGGDADTCTVWFEEAPVWIAAAACSLDLAAKDPFLTTSPT